MVLPVAQGQQSLQNAANERQNVGNFRNRSVVDLTGNASGFLAGAGPISFEIFTALSFVSTVVATVVVGIATQSLYSTGVTLAVGAVATAIIHQFDKRPSRSA